MKTAKDYLDEANTQVPRVPVENERVMDPEPGRQLEGPPVTRVSH